MTNGNQNKGERPEEIIENIEGRLLILTARSFSMAGADQDILQQLVGLLTDDLKDLESVIVEGAITQPEIIRRLNAILQQTILLKQTYE